MNKYYNLINTYKNEKEIYENLKSLNREVAKQYMNVMYEKFEKEVAPKLSALMLACFELWYNNRRHEKRFGYKYEDPSKITDNEYLIDKEYNSYQRINITLSGYNHNSTVTLRYYGIGDIVLNIESGNIDFSDLKCSDKEPDYYEVCANRMKTIIDAFPKFEDAFFVNILSNQVTTLMAENGRMELNIKNLKSEVIKINIENKMIVGEELAVYLKEHEDKMLHAVNGELKIGNLKGGE